MKHRISIIIAAFLAICMLSVAFAGTLGALCEHDDGGEMIRQQVTQRQLVRQYYEWDENLNAIVQVSVYIVTVTVYYQCSVNPSHIIIMYTDTNHETIRTPDF